MLDVLPNLISRLRLFALAAFISPMAPLRLSALAIPSWVNLARKAFKYAATSAYDVHLRALQAKTNPSRARHYCSRPFRISCFGCRHFHSARYYSRKFRDPWFGSLGCSLDFSYPGVSSPQVIQFGCLLHISRCLYSSSVCHLLFWHTSFHDCLLETPSHVFDMLFMCDLPYPFLLSASNFIFFL